MDESKIEITLFWRKLSDFYESKIIVDTLSKKKPLIITPILTIGILVLRFI
jgi:hypothetical protein